MGNPDVLLLDETSEGLAPTLVKALAGLVERFHAEGVSVLLAEQNVRFALRGETEIMKRYLAV